jgi:molybdate transport system substrate-binding protein
MELADMHKLRFPYLRAAGRAARRRLLALLAAALLPAVAPARADDIMVAAAASLTQAFTEIGKAYERKMPEDRVLFTFAASGQLVQQISRGAPVDVLATADLDSMDRADNQRLIYRDSRANFASNKLVLITPGDSKLELAQLQGLGQSGVSRIALGTPESVPAGRYAKQALEKAGLWETLKPKYIYTQNVRQCLDYVMRGEVDAGFVYASDAFIAPVKVRTASEVALDKPIVYPIAVIKGFGNEKRARYFVAFVRSQEGQAILKKYGFLPAP